MKISRNTVGLLGPPSHRARGCVPLFVLITVALAVVVLGRNWIGQRLNLARPQRMTVDLAVAQAALDGGQLGTAIAYAGQILERDGSDEAAYELLIRSLIYRSYSEVHREADRVLALEISREAIQALPRNLNMQAAHAYALLANDSPEEAGRIALRVIQRSQDHVLARIVLSLSYGGQGIFDAALREAWRSVELASQLGIYQLESHRALAIAHGDRGDYQAAIAELERSISISGKLIPLHFELAHYAQQISDIDRATVAYYRILALDEGNVKVRMRLCDLSSRLREHSSALRYCGEVTALLPDGYDGWYQLGREYYLGGDYEQAQVTFHHCTRLQQEQDIAITDRQLECWFLQGQSAEIRGDCDGLLRIYREFLDMAERANLRQTWSYPPEGPPICAQSTMTAQFSSP